MTTNKKTYGLIPDLLNLRILRWRILRISIQCLFNNSEAVMKCILFFCPCRLKLYVQYFFGQVHLAILHRIKYHRCCSRVNLSAKHFFITLPKWRWVLMNFIPYKSTGTAPPWNLKLVLSREGGLFLMTNYNDC